MPVVQVSVEIKTEPFQKLSNTEMTAAVAMRPDGTFEGQPRGFPFDDFNFEDVMLPEDDDMGIPSEDDEVAEEELETETGFGSVIGQVAYSAVM